MKLYNHQQIIVDEDKKKALLALGCGTGKTLTALSLAEGFTVIIAPKTTVEDRTWEKNLALLDNPKCSILVISKETFRRDHKGVPKCTTLILDEVHTQAGLNPTTCYRKKVEIPKASQTFEAVMEYINRVQPERVYPVSATPTRTPMCVLAIAWMLGIKWNYYDFRSTFYTQVRMGQRNIWMVRKDQGTKDRLGRAVQKLGYTGRMSDYFDVPQQTFIVKKVPLTKSQEDRLKTISLEFPDPLVLVGKRHQIENGVLKGDEFTQSETFETGKLEAIGDLMSEYPKVLVFAKYTEQIELIKKYVEDQGVPVFTLTGATKDRGELLTKAESLPECVVVAQASISAGYELPSFRCTIYASQDYSHTNKEQSQWRTLRANNLDKNLYVYLLSGKVDNGVYEALENKSDFHEAIFIKQSGV